MSSSENSSVDGDSLRPHTPTQITVESASAHDIVNESNSFETISDKQAVGSTETDINLQFENSAVAASEQQLDVIEVRKSTREKSLSLKGRENKAAQLSVQAAKLINQQLKNNECILEQVSSMSVEQCESTMSDMHVNFDQITSLYNQINDLCEGHSANSMIVHLYSELELDIKTITDAIKLQRDVIIAAEEKERKEQDKINEQLAHSRLELEQQMFEFQEHMKRKKERATPSHLYGMASTNQINSPGPQQTGSSSSAASPKPRPAPRRGSVDPTATNMRSNTQTIPVHIHNQNTYRPRPVPRRRLSLATSLDIPYSAPYVENNMRPSDNPNYDFSPQASQCNLGPNSGFPIQTNNDHFKGEGSGSQAIRDLVNCLTGTMRMNRLPVLELGEFSGDPVEFADWETSFNSFIGSQNLSNMEKLQYLKKYVKGEAKECLQGYFIAGNSETAYHLAMAQLKERFGNAYDVARAFRKELANWPKIGPKDGPGMRRYADFLFQCNGAMSSASELAILNDCQENEKLAEKLPEWMKISWGRKISEHRKQEHSYPSFQKFCMFVKAEAEVMAEPLLNQPAKESNMKQNKERQSIRSLQTNSSADSKKCDYCGLSNHRVAECYRLQEKPMADRLEFVTSNKLCFSCLSRDHWKQNCEKPATCKKCNKKHPTSLHDSNREKNAPHIAAQHKQDKTSTTEDDYDKKSSTENDEKVTVHAAKSNKALLSMIVPVYVSGSSASQKVLVYALLDTQSDATFITEEVSRQLDLSSTKEMVTISTMNGETKQNVIKYEDIVLRGYGIAANNCAVVTAYEQKTIPCNGNQIPSCEDVKNSSYLKVLYDSLPPKMDLPIGLLIGMNCAEAIQPLDVVAGQKGQPYAVKTMFGWTLCGWKDAEADGWRDTTKTYTHKIQTSQVRALVDADVKISQDDFQFLNILENGVTRQNGYYSFPLPFREDPILPDNRNQAERRLKQLVKCLKRDQTYHDEYFKYMEELFKLGHAEMVNKENPGKSWYIPHFGVRHPKKDKLRVVFDASAKYHNTAINDHLLQGPDQMNNLTGILLRFRKERVAISCDIEKMFHNFYVDQEHRDYLRFLWVEKDLTSIKTCRMTVHLFGATSSPGVATFGLRKLASDYEHVSPKAAEFLRKDFYVDDGLISVSTTQEAKSLIQRAVEMCGKANLRLHKFSSNCKEVLESIPQTETAALRLDIPTCAENMQRVLGLEWSVESDSFRFLNNLKQKPITRRGILSVVSQLYDPIGFIAPFILIGKNILQRVNEAGLDWDEPVPEDINKDWQNWVSQLNSLQEVEIQRCYKPKYFGVVTRAELHHFCDASTQGVGACSYLRQTDDRGNVCCNLIIAKSKVAPMKPTTIPRLELQAAVLASRLSSVIRRELQQKIDQEFFWSDSKVALGYIQNSSKRFHIYVANRVQEIREATQPEQWRHIDSEHNPADAASRGMSIKSLKLSNWLKGPEFLWRDNIDEFTQVKSNTELSNDDPEVKLKLLKTSARPPKKFYGNFKYFSTWNRLVRAIGNARQILKNRHWKLKSLSRAELMAAESAVIQRVQEEHYSEELRCLRQAENLPKKSTITSLSPFIDIDGVLRVGGRLQKAGAFSYLEKHPAVVPKQSHVSKLLIRHFHQAVSHQGRSFTLGALREAGYWITGSQQLIRSEIHHCVKCRLQRGKPQEQRMGELPTERTEPGPPFTNVGVDLFGPFHVKERRSELKRWGVVFTCLYSRAIHIEVVDDISTDSFINSLRCLQAIRGPIKVLACDSGTNFIGAKNELHQELEKMVESRTKCYLQEHRIDFKVNPPASSHRGGAWERQIRTIRAILNNMLQSNSSRLDTTTLRTFLYEVMHTVNSRPLTVDNLCSPGEVVVTPNHLLTMKTRQLTDPPGTTTHSDMYSRLKWRRAQQLAKEFWLVWKNQYLANLTKRQRWECQKRNLSIGDVVAVIEETTMRNEWKIGVVEEVSKGSDGLVRSVMVRLANPLLDRKGIPMYPARKLLRPVQKLVVLMEAEQ